MTTKKLEQKRVYEELKDIRNRMKKGLPTTYTERQRVYITDKARDRAKRHPVEIVQKRVSIKRITTIYVKKAITIM